MDVFTPRQVRLFLDILWIVLGLAVCFGGRRTLGALLLMGAALVFGFFGVKLGELFPMTPVLRLIFFTMFCFWGLCLAYFVSTLWKSCVQKLPGSGKVGDRLFWLTALLGAGITAAALGRSICRERGLLWGLFAVLSILGIFWQVRHGKPRRISYTYDDLFKLGGSDGA